jgi:chorismate mutase
MKDLADWRREIDAIDREIVELLNRRADCVLRLAPLKRERGVNVLDAERERQVLAQLRAANSGPLPDELLDAIFRTVMAAMRELQSQTVGAE